MPSASIPASPALIGAATLKTMSLPAAFGLAVALSGKSHDEIESGMGWGPDAARRILCMTQNYWPSLPSLPRLCEVLGNTVIAEWVMARATATLPERHADAMDVSDALRTLDRLMRETGDVLRVGGEAVADGEISDTDARRVLRELMHVVPVIAAFVAGLQAVREQRGNR
ncbi:phage regulatory CII family protein [Nitratidesulfovibrio liaohensis]|uniref:XRE family transcriptional regulator n=1 Tax=Nitratidesulfovibrio liaohensis TaxID=2604158 RepID=A0ABY9QZQ5_9BACT|nr:phage regulatory CII family protein [Nitratidesulfovibrio liaohensis]WMW64377.1 hypothetical protein KPS_002389 [Nitratidesulfovibrio liaohensis]